jgi:hypothetical protein
VIAWHEIITDPKTHKYTSYQTQGIEMIQELDVIRIKHGLTTKDIEGDEISLAAGTEGTVIVSKIDVPICIVEFGNKPGNRTMVTLNKQDLEPVWSHKSTFQEKPKMKVRLISRLN